MADFLMPSLGADMEHGTIVRWLVEPGASVRRGDVVVEIETEKAEMEVEIFESGVIAEILVAEGETVPVGTPLARVEATASAAAGPPGAAAPRTAREQRPAAEPGAARLPAASEGVGPAAGVHVTPTARVLAEQLGVDPGRVTGSGLRGAVTRSDIERAARTASPTAIARPPAPSPSPVPDAGAGRPRVSPYARVVAADLGVDPAAITGTGPGGAVTATDVRAAAAAPAAPTLAAPAPETAPPSPAPGVLRDGARQRAIGALMERSKREIPHYYLSTAIDVTRALGWMAEENARRPVAARLLPAALLLRAVVLAATEHPGLNGQYLDGEFHPADGVDLSVAIALRDGALLTPAILGADGLTLSELMDALRDLVTRARSGKLRASEMAAGTITVTNLGDAGVDTVQAVIYPPQVAIVGFGRPSERPWADRGMLAVRTAVTASLAADHRVSNGHLGARFLNAVARRLQQPEEL